MSLFATIQADFYFDIPIEITLHCFDTVFK